MNKTIAALTTAAAMAMVTIPILGLVTQALQPQAVAAAQR